MKNIQLLKTIKNDLYNNVVRGETTISLKLKRNKIGYIVYRPHNGQIGILYVSDKFRSKGFGTSLLFLAIDDIF